MRRQDSCSSDKRLHSPVSTTARKGDPNAETIGCMSGIICFLSQYHYTDFRKCKFLTFGKKQNQEKNNGQVGNVSSSLGSLSTTIQAASTSRMMAKLSELNEIGDKSPSSRVSYLQVVSCNVVPRSPTLAAEIRRRSAAPPLVIGRLMGLEEADAPSKDGKDQYYYSRISSQKRQQLLGALDKCDRDLKALKRMIEAISAPPKRSMEAIDNTIVHINNEIKKRSCGGSILKKRSGHELLPSCISLLDDEYSARSPFSNHVSFNINYGRARKRPAGEEDCY